VSQGYTPGDINNQPPTNNLPNGKWQKTGPYDAQVALVSTYPDAAGYGFVGQALRISDAMTSGNFGDQTFSPGLGDEAGEKTAVNANLSGWSSPAELHGELHDRDDAGGAAVLHVRDAAEPVRQS
jgi:hypothetical protein